MVIKRFVDQFMSKSTSVITINFINYSSNTFKLTNGHGKNEMRKKLVGNVITRVKW